MRRVVVVSLGVACALGLSATSFKATPVAAPTVTKEVIAVYFGTVGTDGGTASSIRDMKPLLARQVAASGREFVSRGVSLEPEVEAGIEQLARLGPFDEISVGDNWTNFPSCATSDRRLDQAGIPLFHRSYSWSAKSHGSRRACRSVPNARLPASAARTRSTCGSSAARRCRNSDRFRSAALDTFRACLLPSSSWAATPASAASSTAFTT